MKRLKLYGFLIFALFLMGCSSGAGSLERGKQNDSGNRMEERQDGGEERTAAEGTDGRGQELLYTLEDLPEYSGSPVVELNGNEPEFSEEEKKRTDAFENYSELDALGRCGEAYANICPELMPQEERGSIGQVKPSGWHTVKYNDLIDGNYLYNRCHLIGYQLAGENANEKNLITGTRYLNVEGMLPFEDLVDDYVDATGNHVLYRVTPVFEGDNLVASGVEMEAWSVEDEGEGICFHVYCYNVQPGIGIDYAEGESWEAESGAAVPEDRSAPEEPEPEDAAVPEEPGAQSNVPGQVDVKDVILNTNTRKFHLPDCSSVDDMAEENKQAYSGTIEEIKGMGYSPCKRCLKGY